MDNLFGLQEDKLEAISYEPGLLIKFTVKELPHPSSVIDDKKRKRDEQANNELQNENEVKVRQNWPIVMIISTFILLSHTFLLFLQKETKD